MPTLDPAPEQQPEESGRESLRDYPRRVNDLDISTSEDGCVISRPGQDRIHFLNPTAALILEFCDGQTSSKQIVELVQQAYNLPEPPADDVREALKQLKAEGLLV
jgi:hypothetical protein